MKYLCLSILFIFLADEPRKPYDWLKVESNNGTVESRIKVPFGFVRKEADKKSFAYWLRNLPLKPVGTPVKKWNGELKSDQTIHEAVVDLDFIGQDLQQCIDAIIRLRAEYLWSSGKEDEIEFSYSCCTEKIAWKKWKEGWRTKIIKKDGKSNFLWVKSKTVDGSQKNFREYLKSIMNYAGTLSLARDMKKIETADIASGDAFVEGAVPGLGHGVIVLDIAISPAGKKLMLLGQSFNPTENFNILKSGGKYSPWFEADFGVNLITPQWEFKKEHARRF